MPAAKNTTGQTTALTVDDLTPRQRDALVVLASKPLDHVWGGSEFADLFWPGKTWRRGNNNYGLNTDGSGRTGARMLARLEKIGLMLNVHVGAASRYRLTGRGRVLAQELAAGSGR